MLDVIEFLVTESDRNIAEDLKLPGYNYCKLMFTQSQKGRGEGRNAGKACDNHMGLSTMFQMHTVYHSLSLFKSKSFTMKHDDSAFILSK